MKIVLYPNSKKLITNIIIFSVIFFLLLNSKVVITSITTSTNLFISKLVPALFIYLVITEILINSNKIHDLSFGTLNILSKIFKVPTHTTSAVIIRIFTRLP